MAGVTAQAGVTKTEDLSELYDHKFRKLLKHLDREKPSVAHKKLVYEIFVAYHNAQEEAKHVMHLFEEAVHFQKAVSSTPLPPPPLLTTRTGTPSVTSLPSHPNLFRRTRGRWRRSRVRPLWSRRSRRWAHLRDRTRHAGPSSTATPPSRQRLLRAEARSARARR